MFQRWPYRLFSILFGVRIMLAQTAIQPGRLANATATRSFAFSPKTTSPTMANVVTTRNPTGEKQTPSGVFKGWTIRSFGYDLSPTVSGFDTPYSVMNNPFSVPGLECSFCINRPQTEHSRFTLPPFGAQILRKAAHDRIEFFGTYGGINA
ncbi:MAG TPA: hypothetical protein VFA65_12710 [Bryobacteraceae bacterium]|nr:hypothetical protein [Bryobacteraceae bacterium]